MTHWNTLLLESKHRSVAPEAEVFRFVTLLEDRFGARPLRLWDLGCGSGRHTVAMATWGHQVYATDDAPIALRATRDWLCSDGQHAELEQADMSSCPWGEETFHGVVSWDVLHHSTIENIEAAVNNIFDHLVPGGMFLATMKSDKADLYGRGEEIEPNTFVLDTGREAGVPHHYFCQSELERLFQKRGWEVLAMAEHIIRNVVRPEGFWEYTPFRWTTWGLLLGRPSL